MNHNTPLQIFFSRLSDVNYFCLHFRNDWTKILCVEWIGIWRWCFALEGSVVYGSKQNRICAIEWCCRSDTISLNPMQSTGFKRLSKLYSIWIACSSFTSQYPTIIHIYSPGHRSMASYCWLTCCSNLYVSKMWKAPTLHSIVIPDC